jgi:hypothetical protein
MLRRNGAESEEDFHSGWGTSSSELVARTSDFRPGGVSEIERRSLRLGLPVPVDASGSTLAAILGRVVRCPSAYMVLGSDCEHRSSELIGLIEKI